MSESENHVRTEDLAHRVAKLERQIEEVQHDNKNIVATLSSIQASVNQITVSLGDVRSIRDKMIEMQLKLESVQELKKLMIGTLLTVIPGSIAVFLELLLKFVSSTVK